MRHWSNNGQGSFKESLVVFRCFCVWECGAEVWWCSKSQLLMQQTVQERTREEHKDGTKREWRRIVVCCVCFDLLWFVMLAVWSCGIGNGRGDGKLDWKDNGVVFLSCKGCLCLVKMVNQYSHCRITHSSFLQQTKFFGFPLSHWFSPSSASRYLLSITQGTILCLFVCLKIVVSVKSKSFQK